MQKSNKKIGIIGAMDIEVKALKSWLKPVSGEKEVKTVSSGNCTFVEGVLDDTEVVIVQSGVGKVNAALCAQRLILQFGVTHVINTGIAGAMAHGLKVQDVVVSSDAVYHDMNAVEFGYKITEIPGMKCSDFTADSYMVEAALMAFERLPEAKGHSIVKGRIATGDQFIAKKELKEAIKVNCNPACVEMEGTAIAHACYVNEIPFVIIRCMSDMADDNGEETYNFNEAEAADLSAKLVRSMLKLF